MSVLVTSFETFGCRDVAKSRNGDGFILEDEFVLVIGVTKAVTEGRVVMRAASSKNPPKAIHDLGATRRAALIFQKA